MTEVVTFTQVITERVVEVVRRVPVAGPAMIAGDFVNSE
jgi:hypothetical protein